jgi:hypothetical protein
MLSFHLYLDLPCDLLVRGFHLNIFLTVLVSDILCTWPNQLSLHIVNYISIFYQFIQLFVSFKSPYLIFFPNSISYVKNVSWPWCFSRG